MPVPCRRRRQAYDVPSTVSRGVLADLLSLSRSRSRSLGRFPFLLIPPPPPVVPRPFARALIIPPRLSLSADGEPLSKSYATQRRSSVDYFSKSSGSRIFKWQLNETGSPGARGRALPASRFPRPRERLVCVCGACILYSTFTGIPLAISPLSSLSPLLSSISCLFVHIECLPVLVLAAETVRDVPSSCSSIGPQDAAAVPASCRYLPRL